MARRSHGRRNTHSLSTSRERNSQSFFKLMVQPSIQSNKLGLPASFAKTYGEELSTAAVLTVPTRESWKVELVKEGNELRFHDGWKEFVEYYSIGFAYFLMFMYKGNSNFEVCIFDTTTCEISYPYNPCHYCSRERILRKKQHVDNDTRVEASDVSESDKQMCDDRVEDVASGASDDENLDGYEEDELKTEANGVECGNLSGGDLWLKHKETLALAGFAKPDNPFFVAVIKKRHLQGRNCVVYVPAYFSRPYLRSHQAGNSVKLEASDGNGRQRWPLRYTTRGPCNLYGGWLSFARDNNLKRIPEMFARTFREELGTCVTLTVPTQESWKVKLVSKGYNNLWFSDGWRDFVDNYSVGFAYFLQFIYKGSSNFEVHIFDRTTCEISYPYKPRKNPHDEKRPQKKQRADSNVVAEVVNLESEEDEVSVHENDEEMRDNDEPGNPYEDSVWLKHEAALALLGFSKPKNPFFVTLIKERHLTTTQFMYAPAHFAQVNLWCQPMKSVELEGPDGTRWPVQCARACRGCNLRGGWTNLARDNDVEIGDVCVFELVFADAKNCILKVHVFKGSQIRSSLLD